MMDLTVSRRVLITGGASGLGKALAMFFAERGHQVAIADVHDQRGEEALRELQQLNPSAIYLHGDVTQTDSVAEVIAQVQAAFGGIDIMINNAGIAGGGVSESEWRRVMEINFYGVWRGCDAVTPIFKAQGSGHIVNIASMAGLLNAPGMGAYNVAKASVVSLSETLQPELAVYGAGLTVVCPSFFQTNLGDSLHKQSAVRKENLQKLMDKSELSAEDIAAMIYAAVGDNKFLLIPHEKAQLAYQHKQDNPAEFLQLQYDFAAKQKAAAGD